MSDEMRDKLAEWLTDWLDNSAPYDTETEWDGADMADALLAWLKEQPPVISDERAEALRRERTLRHTQMNNAGFVSALRILGLLDVVEVKE